MEAIWTTVSLAFGLEAESLAAWQMALRATIVYVFGLLVVRLGEKRFIGKFAAFDVIIGFMLGSILASAITNVNAFPGNLVAGAVLVAMHYAFATAAFHSDRFGDLIKGGARTLVVDGEIQWTAMRRSHISEKDLKGALRENAQIEDVSRVRQAQLERSGNISVLMKNGD